jgi:Carbohydrate esterase, sialic acid-specific acetylesterase
MTPRFHGLRLVVRLFGAICLCVLSSQAGLVRAGGTSTTRPVTGGLLPVLVLAGQSNMIGWVTNVADLPTDEQATQTSVLFYGPNENGSTWAWLTPPTVTNNRFGPEISLGQHLVISGTDDLVAQVKYAVSGSNLASDWDPARTSPYLYAQMLARVQSSLAALRAAHPDRHVIVAGFFWMQGEADGLDAAMSAAYAVNLAHFIEHVRADFHSPWLPVFVGRIRLSTHYASTVRQAEAEVAENVPDVRLVDTDALPMAPDGLHYTSAGVVTLGNDFAESFIDWQRSQRYLFLPLLVRGAAPADSASLGAP